MTTPKALSQTLCLILFLFSFTATTLLGVPSDKPLTGVKIYGYNKASFYSLFEKWQELGIDTAFAGETLALKPEFMKFAKQYGIKVFVILPTFYNPEALKKDPELFAVTGKGEKARDEWVEFVCPNRRDYRRQHLEKVKRLIRQIQPDGISFDFIRYFVFWEKVYPDKIPDPMDNTCFCTHCLEDMQKDLKFTFPAGLKSASQKAAWVLKHHKQKWVLWKSGIITSMVKDIASAAREVKQGILINVHTVPWRQKDFNGGQKVVTGQDIAALSPYTDFFSPMCYAHMVKQTPGWIHSVVKDIAAQTRKKILPSIQVGIAYRKEPLTPEVFMQSLRQSLEPPSHGVVFWNWKALAEDQAKQKIQSESSL